MFKVLDWLYCDHRVKCVNCIFLGIQLSHKQLFNEDDGGDGDICLMIMIDDNAWCTGTGIGIIMCTGTYTGTDIGTGTYGFQKLHNHLLQDDDGDDDGDE